MGFTARTQLVQPHHVARPQRVRLTHGGDAVCRAHSHGADDECDAEEEGDEREWRGGEGRG